jgi:hypothetical protein
MHSPLTFNIHHLAGSCFPQHLGTGEQLRRFPVKLPTTSRHVAEVVHTGHPAAFPLVNRPAGGPRR